MSTRLLIPALAALAVLAVCGPASGVTSVQIPGLQVALREHGLYAGPIDGVEGPQTAQAVRRFQRRMGLTVDGVAGPRTRGALGRLGRPLYGTRTLARGSAGWDVSVLQFLLVRRGHLTETPDGHFGPATERALRRFQERWGLLLDGVAGPRTLRALVWPGLPRNLRATLDFWARHYDVDPHLVRGLAWMESGYQPHVVSRDDAFGVMQVTAATWNFVEVVLLGQKVSRNAAGNIRVGVAFLRHLLEQFKWDERLALAAYYQGARSVRERGVLAETERYIENVLALKSRL